MEEIRYITHMFPFAKDSANCSSIEELDKWVDTDEFTDLFVSFVQVCVRPLYSNTVTVVNKPVFTLGDKTECSYGWYQKQEKEYFVPFATEMNESRISMHFTVTDDPFATGFKKI